MDPSQRHNGLTVSDRGFQQSAREIPSPSLSSATSIVSIPLEHDSITLALVSTPPGLSVWRPGNSQPRGSSTTTLRHWAKNSKCSWDGCNSKEIFKTEKAYQDHLQNKHTKPLLCQVPGCTHQGSFRNEGDLARHKLQKHSSVWPFQCPYTTCNEAFARKDKWKQHLVEIEHDGDHICSYTHCIQFQDAATMPAPTQAEFVAHLLELHSCYSVTKNAMQYSCALGLCAFTLPHHWGKKNLAEHLEEQHGVADGDKVAGKAVLENQTYVLRPEHLLRTNFYEKNIEWEECRLCSKVQSLDLGLGMSGMCISTQTEMGSAASLTQSHGNSSMGLSPEYIDNTMQPAMGYSAESIPQFYGNSFLDPGQNEMHNFTLSGLDYSTMPFPKYDNNSFMDLDSNRMDSNYQVDSSYLPQSFNNSFQGLGQCGIDNSAQTGLDQIGLDHPTSSLPKHHDNSFIGLDSTMMAPNYQVNPGYPPQSFDNSSLGLGQTGIDTSTQTGLDQTGPDHTTLSFPKHYDPSHMSFDSQRDGLQHPGQPKLPSSVLRRHLSYVEPWSFGD